MKAKSRALALKLIGLVSAGALAAVLASCETAPAGPPFAWDTPQDGECGNLLPYLAVDGGGPRNTIYGQSSGNALIFVAGMQIVADGAPNAYNPDNVSGLDDIKNARGDSLATDRYGKPFVQSAAEKYPGFYISKTELTDPDIGDSAEPRRYVDARQVPYIELPGGERARKAMSRAGMHLGDLVVVYNVRTKKTAAAVWADTDDDDLGIGSINLAEKLGYDDTSPRTGGTDDPENVYLVFPGTSLGFPHRVREIERSAYQTFVSWGGQMRMTNCAEALNAH